MLDLEEYADIAYAFMTGVPGWGSSGYCMMGPEELKRQRWTYVKYWLRKMNKDISEVIKAFKKQ